MILLDTHTLLWWLDGSSLIPRPVSNRIAEFKKEGTICISAVSVWEISLLVQKKKAVIQREIHEWTERLEGLPFLKITPVDHWIFLKSTQLLLPFHKDPADRIIVATAQKLGATLITKDDKILKYPHVKSFWKEDR